MSLRRNTSGGIRRRLAKARSLSGAEWLLLVRGFFLLAAVQIGLRLFSFGRLVALLRREDFRSRRSSVDPDRAAYLVELASRFQLRRPSCLQKALVLYRLLRGRGVRVDLVIRAKKARKGLAAHAWLEHQGHIILGAAEAACYAPLLALDAAGGLAKRDR